MLFFGQVNKDYAVKGQKCLEKSETLQSLLVKYASL
jgi:hypothetical protein